MRNLNNVVSGCDWSDSSSRMFFLLPLLLSLTILSACSSITSPTEEPIYYTMEYDPPGENLRELAAQPLTLRMERFTIAPDYDTARIVYRDASYTRGTYANHRWHANPEQLVRSFLGRDIQTAGILQAVFMDAATIGTSYGLSGTVEEFLELEESSNWEAVLTLTVTLTDRSPASDTGKKIIFQKRFSAREKANEKTPQALAKAMSLALREISGAVILAIKDATTSHPQPAASISTPSR